MAKFTKEFKEFISRGNVVDMAVGVIIGGAFSAIVTALTTHVLMPVINWFLLLITGGNGLENIYTYLSKAYELDELGNATAVIDLTKSIYIDWGAFITAIINFILIALVLFFIIKGINKARDIGNSQLCGFTKEEYAALKKQGKSQSEIKALAEARDAEAKKKAEEEAAAAAAKAAEPTTTEKLLMEIRDSLKK